MGGTKRASRLLIFAGILGIAADASALDERRSVRIGAPARPATLVARTTRDGLGVELRAAGAPARVTLQASAAATIETEEVALAGGGTVVVARVSDGSARHALLFGARNGRPLLLWQGRLDLVGDPGERRASVLEVADRTGDGAPDVVVGRTREDTYVCGERPAVLEPRAVHPETLELRQVVLRRLPELPPGGELEVTATPEAPVASERPLVPALHFRRASSVAGGREGSAPVVPGGLADGDAATAWVEGAGSGTFEFATGAWAGGSGLPIRAFSIVPRPEGAAAASTAGPAALWLVGDRGPRLHVRLPAGAAPGARFWVVPPEPLAWTCVSVVLDAGDGARGPAHVALAEVAAYSEIDFGGGIPHLVAELSAGASRADRAEALLGQLGRPALDALAAAYEDMPEAERVRAVRIRGRLARTTPEALDALAASVVDGPAAVSAEARRALFALGEPGARALAAVAAREPSGEALAELAERRPSLAVGPVLDALAAPGGTEKPILRSALARCSRSVPGEVEAAVAARGDVPAELRVVLAEALAAGGDAVRPLAMRTLDASLAEATGFEARFRAARAAKALAAGGLSAPAVAFLEAQSRDAEEWMMRAAAIDALAAVPDVAAGSLAAGLEDPYPRVRIAAIAALGPRLAADRAAAVRVAELARRDPFPIVRDSAVRALAGVEAARPVIEAALRDRAERVRAGAIETLATRRDAAAWSKVEERIRDEDEWPVVTDAAVGFARALCVDASVDALRVVVARAERPRPWDPDLASASLALEALGALGTPAAREALAASARSATPAVAQAARAVIERAAGSDSPCRTPSGPPGP